MTMVPVPGQRLRFNQNLVQFESNRIGKNLLPLSSTWRSKEIGDEGEEERRRGDIGSIHCY